MNKCEYCDTEFSSESALKKHKVTAKYCLALRDEPVEDIKTHDCDYCEYSTTRKYHLVRHIAVCKNKASSELAKEYNTDVQLLLLKKDLEMTQKDLKTTQKQLEIAEKRLNIETSKPKITNLTFNMRQQFYQQNLQPITRVLESLSDEIDRRYTSNHFLKGQEGSAQLVSEILNENNRYYITDNNSGDVFMYKDDDNIIRTDDKARLIIEASKDPLEKTATRECRNKIEEAQDLYEDDNTTKINCINKYKSKLQEIKELPTHNIKFRKKLSENTFISSQSMKTNKDPEDMNKGFALLDRIKPKDISLYFTDKKIQEELDKLTDEEIDLFSDVKGIVNFLVEKFLLINERLIYKYKQEDDNFIYHEQEEDKMIKKSEKDPLRFNTTFFYGVKKFLLKNKKNELCRYVKDLDNTIIRVTLIELLTKVENQQL